MSRASCLYGPSSAHPWARLDADAAGDTLVRQEPLHTRVATVPTKRGSVVESPECRAAGDSRQRKGPTEAVFPADAVHCCQSAYGCTNLELFCPLSRPGTRKEYYPLAYLPVGTDSDYASLGVFIRVAVPPCAQRPPPPAIGRAARCARAPRLVAHFHNAVLYEYQGTVYVLVQLTHKSYQPGHMRRQRLHRLHRATRCDPALCPVRPACICRRKRKGAPAALRGIVYREHGRDGGRGR